MGKGVTGSDAAVIYGDGETIINRIFLRIASRYLLSLLKHTNDNSKLRLLRSQLIMYLNHSIAKDHDAASDSI